HRSIFHSDPVRRNPRPRGDHAMDLVADEVDRRSVVDGEPGGELAGAQPPVVLGTALRITVVVGATAPREKTEALNGPEVPFIGVREPLLEPADGSGAHPR